MEEKIIKIDFISLPDGTSSLNEEVFNKVYSPYQQFLYDLANLVIPVMIVFCIIYLVVSSL